MMEKTIGVAIIGAGMRSRSLMSGLLRDGRKIRVEAIYDPDVKLAGETALFLNSADAKICKSFEGVLENPDVDWLMIFSPNAMHKEQIIAGFDAGKNVFSEKPLATTISDCHAIQEAQQRTGQLFATGYVLRYSPLYVKAKEIIDSGVIGKIVAINASENIPPRHGAYIMCNWRCHTSLAGPHILEKCCHDLDVINWFTGSVPTRVFAFGDLDIFTPENAYLFDKHKLSPDADAFAALKDPHQTFTLESDSRQTLSAFAPWHDPHGKDNPFVSDKDLMDNLVAILQYRSGIKVQFQATMSNAIPERRMYITGTEGTIIVEFYQQILQYCKVGSEEIHTLPFQLHGHGGGDKSITGGIYDAMQNGTPLRCSVVEGLESAVTALAIDTSAKSGELYDLEEDWKKLNR